MTPCWPPFGTLALVLGGAMGSFHRAWRSPTQETWSKHRAFGCRLPSAKTTSDIVIGAICSIGLPKFADLVLPDVVNLKVGDQAPVVQWAIAYGIAFIVSWEATVRSWVIREQGREPAIKNSAPAFLPAKSADEMEPRR